uniref:Uncharacterized protein n=1 Tax=Asparagus officinalis TaxID=4686 RepID=Q2XNY7_ASPOF|nr:hypothetical protein 10.t00026 [Asparagus officinalis]ABB55285.1 hypothetical protein 10.t00028 [Asparagus officinalis]
MESITKKDTNFPANNLATTVGATDLAAEIGASQPRIQIPVVEEVEYEFDQTKFEEYLSSSSRSTSPRKSKKSKFSSNKKVRWYEEVEATNDDLISIDAKVASGEAPPTSNQIKLVPTNSSITKGAVTLSKRARQRQRQRLAKQIAKAMESTDGVRYNADLKNKRGKQPQQQMNGAPSKSPMMEWVRVKRNRSTLEERIRKRRALSAQARVQAEEARRKLQKEVAKKPPPTRKVWRPKSEAAVQTKKQQLQPPTKIQPPANPAKSPRIPIATPGDHAESSRRREPVLERFGPIADERSKAPIQECLGSLRKP